MKELIATDMALMRVYNDADCESSEKAYRKSYKVPDNEVI